VNEEALAHWGLSRQKQKYALVGLVSYNESSVHGHESFKIEVGVFFIENFWTNVGFKALFRISRT
jgi:hypothetical protein